MIQFPIGGDIVKVIKTNEICRVKSSDMRTNLVKVFIAAGLDEDGDVIFDVQTFARDELEKVKKY